MKRKWWPYVLAVALGAPLLYLLSTMFEHYEEEIDLGWSIEALRNPYLAAERFLANTGLEVESSYQLEIVSDLSADATLFISDANAVLNERRAERLIEWMSDGGHVIIAAQRLPEGQRDVFLDRFGVEKYAEGNDPNLFDSDSAFIVDTDEGEEEQSLGDMLREQNENLRQSRERQKEKKALEEQGKMETLADELAFDERYYDAGDIMYLAFDGVDHEYRILLDREEYLTHPVFYELEGEEYGGYRPFYWEGTEAGVGFMQFEVGDGLLTVLSDQTIWTSDRIGLFDHAYLLQLLTDNSDKVVFLYGAVVPDLFDLLWQHYFELCIVLLAILAAWLLYRGRRFGPVLDTSNLGRRSFREHLSAVGDFFWRQKRREELLGAVREAIWRELRKKYYAVGSYNHAERLAKLCEVVEETPETVRELMTGAPAGDEFDFYQQVRSLQKLRKQL